MTPEQWREKKNKTEQRHEDERGALWIERESVVYPSMDELRPASASDIWEDRVVYYPHPEDPDRKHWKVVEEVRHPDDDFKAYVADDGCRYGLHGAYVKKAALRAVAGDEGGGE